MVNLFFSCLVVGGELWKTNVLLSAFFFPGWVLIDANMNTTVYSWKEWSSVKLLFLFVTGRLFSLTCKTQFKRYSLQRSFRKDLKFLRLQCKLLKILSLIATQSKSNALLCESFDYSRNASKKNELSLSSFLSSSSLSFQWSLLSSLSLSLLWSSSQSVP